MFAAVLLAAVTAFLGLTQTGTDDSARVRGTVTAGAGQRRPVAGALVVATSDSDVRVTRADGRGRYLFLTLLPGIYVLSAYPGDAQRGGPHVSGALYWTGDSPASQTAAARCRNDEQSFVELSAGVEYLANLDLIADCP